MKPRPHRYKVAEATPGVVALESVLPDAEVKRLLRAMGRKVWLPCWS